MKIKNHVVLLCLFCLLLSCGKNAETPDTEIIKISILGDSYSTFKDFVTPNTNSAWYPHSDNDVVKVEQTWWYQFIQEYNGVLEINNSFSGATVCNTGRDGVNTSYISYITRMTNLGNPDLVVVFGGTNDNWLGSPLGDYKYSDWTEEDLKSFRPAFAYMLDYLTGQYSNDRIINIINTELKSDIITAQKSLCKYYNVKCVQLKNIEKQAGHPSIKGMVSIKDQVLQEISTK
jgi:hypothetical protein